jgi:hypothetical protein
LITTLGRLRHVPGERPRRSSPQLLSEGSNHFVRGVDAEPRPQDREIEPSGTVFGEAIATAADRTNQADRVKHAITQRIVAGTLLGVVRFLDEAAGAEQPLEEAKGR